MSRLLVLGALCGVCDTSAAVQPFAELRVDVSASGNPAIAVTGRRDNERGLRDVTHGPSRVRMEIDEDIRLIVDDPEGDELRRILRSEMFNARDTDVEISASGCVDVMLDPTEGALIRLHSLTLKGVRSVGIFGPREAVVLRGGITVSGPGVTMLMAKSTFIMNSRSYSGGSYIVTSRDIESFSIESCISARPATPEAAELCIPVAGHGNIPVRLIMNAEWQWSDGLTNPFERWVTTAIPDHRQERDDEYYFNREMSCRAFDELARRVLPRGRYGRLIDSFNGFVRRTLEGYAGRFANERRIPIGPIQDCMRALKTLYLDTLRPYEVRDKYPEYVGDLMFGEGGTLMEERTYKFSPGEGLVAEGPPLPLEVAPSPPASPPPATPPEATKARTSQIDAEEEMITIDFNRMSIDERRFLSRSCWAIFTQARQQGRATVPAKDLKGWRPDYMK